MNFFMNKRKKCYNKGFKNFKSTKSNRSTFMFKDVKRGLNADYNVIKFIYFSQTMNFWSRPLYMEYFVFTYINTWRQHVPDNNVLRAEPDV